MSTSPISRSPGEKPVRYEPVGFASIELSADKNGVALTANSDGFRSLARLFDSMAAHEGSYAHIGLLPTLQLTATSEALELLRRQGGELPNGDTAPKD